MSHILSAPSLRVFWYEYSTEEILQRRQERSASLSQAASLRKNFTGADGETVIGEACADTAQRCSWRLKLEDKSKEIRLCLCESVTHAREMVNRLIR